MVTTWSHVIFYFLLGWGRECVCGKVLIGMCKFVIQSEYSEFVVLALKIKFLAA